MTNPLSILSMCNELKGHSSRDTEPDSEIPRHLREPFYIQSYSERKPSHRLVLAAPCNHCLGGDKRLLSQPTPTTAQTNYRTGKSCSHHRPCDSTCPFSLCSSVLIVVITAKPCESDQRGEWCSPLEEKNKKEEEHGTDSLLAECTTVLFSVWVAPRGGLDIIQVQCASHHCLFMAQRSSVRWKSSKGLTVLPLRRIICSSIKKAAFIDI